jgi:hypothetical protein
MSGIGRFQDRLAQRKRADEESSFRARKNAWRGPWSPMHRGWTGGLDIVVAKMIRGLRAVSFG